MKTRRFQKGYIMCVGFNSALSGVVTLNAQTGANQASDNVSGTAIWRFNTDGTVDRDDDAGVVQVASSTDWIIPNSSASSGYELKWVQVSGDAPTNTTNNIAENTWTSLGSRIDIGAFAGIGSYETGIVTVSIRLNGGSVLDSANFEWEAIELP